MNYHKITYPDLENGLGVRITLWVSGCPHHCQGCHNPETWSLKSGKPVTKEIEQELFNILDKYSYLDGITFSGGDPFHILNVGTVTRLCKLIKSRYPHKNIWLYTGYTYEWLMKRPIYAQALEYVDVLVDGEYEEDKRDISIPFCGSTNQRIILVKESRNSNSIVLWKPKE